MMNGMGFGGMGLGWLLWLGIIGLAIWAVIKFAGGGLQIAGKQTTDALSILKSRYARGELTKAEFEQIKKDVR